MTKINIALPELPSGSLEDKLYNEFVIVYNAIRKMESALNYDLGLAGETSDLWSDLEPADGVSTRKDRVYAKCSETINYGQMVSFHNVSGELRARLAKNTSAPFRAWAVCETEGAHTAGEIAEFALGNCKVNSIGGMSPGQEYFLSSTPGAIVNVPDPLTETNIQQSIGVALSATDMWFCPSAAGKLVSLTITP